VLPRAGFRGFATESGSVAPVPLDRQRTPDSEGLPPVANLLAIAEVATGKPLVYFLGAGWSRSGDFPDEAAWVRSVRRFAERQRSPLIVTAAGSD
jgi:hypothetical protein